MSDENDVPQPLTVTQVERDLGVLVSNNLKFGPQCKVAAKTALWKFGVLKKVFSSRSPILWEVLWKAHIRPHLEHAIQAWSPYDKKDIDCLERVQRKVTKHIAGMKASTIMNASNCLTGPRSRIGGYVEISSSHTERTKHITTT